MNRAGQPNPRRNEHATAARAMSGVDRSCKSLGIHFSATGSRTELGNVEVSLRKARLLDGLHDPCSPIPRIERFRE
jgi:hypothetical protein